MKNAQDTSHRSHLREQVESLLPEWRSWYPSLFHAAEDLGLIRAHVCSPSSLMLSNRHASVQQEALQAFKEKWSVEDEPELPAPLPRLIKRGLAALPRDLKASPGKHAPPNRNAPPNKRRR